jgi:diacylglycerol kinase (ATP)
LLDPLPFAAAGTGIFEGPCHGTRVAGRRGASGATFALIPVRAIVLHNPTAGSGDVSAEGLLTALAAGGISSRYCSTKQPDFADALGEPADLVVAAGGDGTVVKVISHLRNRSTPIAILPLGGANNIARSLGITANPLEIARKGWRKTKARCLDFGTAAGPWGRRLFVESVGVGALAEAMAVVDERDVTGPEKSGLARQALFEQLAAAQPRELRLTIDGREIAFRCLLAEIMNIASTGPRLLLAPAADPGDGLLDLVCAEPEARADMLAWLGNSSEHAPPLTIRRGCAFAFEWRQEPLHVGDAFFAPPERPCTVEVVLLPDPVTVLVPEGIPPSLEIAHLPAPGGMM